MIEDFIDNLIKEDIARGDLFEKIAPSRDIKAKLIAKSNGVLAGELYLRYLFKKYDIKVKFLKKDGEKFQSFDILLELKGNSNIILKLERSILNILMHASGIASNTAYYVELLKDYDIKILDTRKTRPLLREFEKYATLIGGAVNHRFGLDDCLMLKDTHLKTIDNLKDFIKEARKKIPFTSKIEVECESFEQAKEAMSLGVDIIMLDNFALEGIKEFVEFRNKNFKNVLIELSGGINKDNILDYAKTGADAISSGALIHQATWLDMSMKFIS